MKIGIYNPYVATKGGGEKVMLAMAAYLANEKGHNVTLVTHSKVDFELLGDYFGLDLSKLHHHRIHFRRYYSLAHRLPMPQRVRNLIFDMKVIRILRRSRFDVFVNNTWQSNLPNPSKLGIYMCMFPQKIRPSRDMTILKRVYVFLMDAIYRLLARTTKSSIFSYDLITANSAYTQDYIQRYWGVDSQILYPICENMKNDTKKEKIILHVGRFFENYGENHHKRQDLLVDEFAKMTNLQKEGWELHFAGTVAEDVGALRYIMSLARKAEGLPVKFHFNCSFGELKELYNRSSIYWHATGYGSNARKHPEKQEHFGISTVEAMTAGSIPVALNTAGQKETVADGRSGFLWKTPKELRALTNKVVNMKEPELKAMQQAAIDSAKNFEEAAFYKRVNELFSNLTNKKI